VGTRVGTRVGTGVGLKVGLRVGKGVGAGDGMGVGRKVGFSFSCCKSTDRASTVAQPQDSCGHMQKGPTKVVFF
jgi:hypothetical protein